jgi:hypothetical protein
MSVKLLVEHCYNRSSKEKKYKNAREDLNDLRIRPELYTEEIDTGTDLLVAATTLS